MKIGRTLLTVVGIIILVGVVFSAYALLTVRDGNETDTPPPKMTGAPAELTDPLARGEYLTRAADCQACHTVPGGKPYAGGMAFKMPPLGIIYSTNITADKETGIGDWSDDDFVRALHAGVRKDGKPLYPAFPYTSYTALSRADILAIKAYLFSLPTARAPAKANELSFPFNQRWGISFWNAVFLKKQRFQADSGQSDQWNRGAYLATALGHCAECHTPRNVAFALKSGRQFAGETLQGWKAYNISSDREHGIGDWSDQALTSYLSSGHAEGHGAAAGPMGEAVQYSLRYLSQPDIAALVAYLRTVKPQTGGMSVQVNTKPTQALASSALLPAGSSAETGLGKQVFEGACASCHAWDGSGRQSPRAALLGSAAVNDPTANNLTQIVLKGNGSHTAEQTTFMPDFGHAYNDAEIAALANFVVSHFGDKQGTVTAKQVGESRKQ